MSRRQRSLARLLSLDAKPVTSTLLELVEQNALAKKALARSGCILVSNLNAQGGGTVVEGGGSDIVRTNKLRSSLGLLPEQLAPGNMHMSIFQEWMGTCETRDGVLVFGATSSSVRELVVSSTSSYTVCVNLSGRPLAGQGHTFMFSSTINDFDVGACKVLAGLSAGAQTQRVAQGGFSKRLPVQSAGSLIPALQKTFTEAQLKILDPMFAGLIFDSGLAFLSFYEPTTHLDGSPEFLELQWKIKHMAAQATRILARGLERLGYTVIMGMDANSDLTAEHSISAPGGVMQRAFQRLGLQSAWGSDDQATPGGRLIDFIFSRLKAVAAGCVKPKELGFKSDHNLVWAVYRLPEGGSKKQKLVA